MAETPPKNQTISRLEAIGFVWDVFLSVAVPSVAFALLGRWLDRQWQISPAMTVIGLLLALISAGLLITRKAQSMAARMKGPRV